jgi:hypothetical protein
MLYRIYCIRGFLTHLVLPVHIALRPRVPRLAHKLSLMGVTVKHHNTVSIIVSAHNRAGSLHNAGLYESTEAHGTQMLMRMADGVQITAL